MKRTAVQATVEAVVGEEAGEAEAVGGDL